MQRNCPPKLKSNIMCEGNGPKRAAGRSFLPMETNVIIEELKARATLDWNPEQKAYFVKIAEDARPVQCVRMRDVFTPEQMRFLRIHYHARQKECYRNAAEFVVLCSWESSVFPEPGVKYVEGFAYSCGLLPIEHAFVKIGEKYIDPTFERALHLDIRKEMYASLIELECAEMNRLQAETGFYGELYQYAYLKRFRADLAAKKRALNPHK